MKIVIDIDEKDYKFIKSVNSIMKNSDTFQRIATDLFRATQEGTPLSKGHGDLIDLNALKGELWWVTDCPHIKLTEQAIDIWKAIDTTKTVIPADEVD